MNKTANAPNKTQCLHQQNHPRGTLAFVLESPGTERRAERTAKRQLSRGWSSRLAGGGPTRWLAGCFHSAGFRVHGVTP